MRSTQREGTAEPCFVQRMVEEGEYTPEKEELTKWAATSAYGGGIDTTVSSVSAFFLAMTMFPHVFLKARTLSAHHSSRLVFTVPSATRKPALPPYP